MVGCERYNKRTNSWQGRVPHGVHVGVVGMQEGGEREIIIPPSQGYGTRGTGHIQANSTLRWTVKMKENKHEEWGCSHSNDEDYVEPGQKSESNTVAETHDYRNDKQETYDYDSQDYGTRQQEHYDYTNVTMDYDWGITDYTSATATKYDISPHSDDTEYIQVKRSEYEHLQEQLLNVSVRLDDVLKSPQPKAPETQTTHWFYSVLAGVALSTCALVIGWWGYNKRRQRLTLFAHLHEGPDDGL